MTTPARLAATLAALGALAGCRDRTVADDDSVPPKPPDMGAPAESEGDSEGGVVCREGLVACDGECVDLRSNDQHCGACGHACKEPVGTGPCLDGACPPTWWCGEAGRGLVTCNDVCATHGQACYEGPQVAPSRGCRAAYQLYFDNALENCELGLGGQTNVVAPCSAPIDWSIEGGWNRIPAQAVACCCTQDLPP
jgi:hypothetical protein